MNNEFDDLQRKWQKNKEQIRNEPMAMDTMLAAVTKKKASTIRFQYGNIVVLLITLVVISLFFYYIAPVQQILSRIGVGLMIGGLFLRIIIEFISIIKSKKVDIVNNVLSTTQETINYYNFRKRIHGPITVIIILLYTIGFYMITPEFSLYFSTWQMILINTSYIIAAAIFIPIIRKSVKQEVKTLHEIIELKEKIIAESVS
ncbi:hypothetical protein AWE51_13890 [Aquimarina aggregata]|uniref:Uncharacterized protein n=1 Tax=Aquimarina aggregata TaxID=1642818 RepID=A0A162XJP6_9FLAO|nr:hypothetical protein [Aquimarina aggregata]KZS38677.1 hypothetical protein AWE51_13890 [Aquimarina aggregata]